VYSKPPTTQEIENIIHSLKAMDSCGYDEISTQILKLSLPFISSAMNFECNRILSTDKFPYSLKYYTVKPLHKKGNKQEISNYTPISLSTSLSKIGEKVMYTRLRSHLTKYIILSSEQYSFRKNLTTDNATYTPRDKILTAMYKKPQAESIFCIVEKAFNCVDHNVLLLKMELYGIISKNKTLYTISYRQISTSTLK
jgi:hypothetical protein